MLLAMQCIRLMTTGHVLIAKGRHNEDECTRMRVPNHEKLLKRGNGGFRVAVLRKKGDCHEPPFFESQRECLERLFDRRNNCALVPIVTCLADCHRRHSAEGSECTYSA